MAQDNEKPIIHADQLQSSEKPITIPDFPQGEIDSSHQEIVDTLNINSLEWLSAHLWLTETQEMINMRHDLIGAMSKENEEWGIGKYSAEVANIYANYEKLAYNIFEWLDNLEFSKCSIAILLLKALIYHSSWDNENFLTNIY